ncbi:hypothetical protein APS67_000346 [Streptomyces sp. AVP053U2]|nr:hypothetical protein APS67_000346 [Streptomyces sp. AVP053U2]
MSSVALNKAEPVAWPAPPRAPAGLRQGPAGPP